MNKIPVVLSIAGTDPSGGAGISADIKAISATGSYAMAVITALVSQNTCGVTAVENLTEACLRTQMRAVFDDVSPKAIKIGMLQETRIIETVFDELNKHKLPHVVFDPVMVAKDGTVLLELNAIELLKQKIPGIVYLITPNIFEASHLLDKKIESLDDMEQQARRLGMELQVNVLLKGGHFNGSQSPDVLFDFEHSTCTWFKSPRIMTKNTHGTGCSLSSAIASFLAQGLDLQNSVHKAKMYITHAISSGASQTWGRGNGSIDHFYFLENRGYDSSCHAESNASPA